MSPGQEREEQPALDEDDHQADPEELGAEPLQQPLGVHPADADSSGAGRVSSRPTEVTRGHPNRGTLRVRLPFLHGRAPSRRGRRAGAVRPDAARAGRGRGRAVGGPVAGRGRQYDPELLAHGDRRNVVDRYRYWTMEAIVADLDRRRHDFHVAIENWQHDFNIGTIVRTANAFLAAEVHIVGNRRWNRRGAMVTDRYQHVRHHETRRRARGVPPRARRAGRCALLGIDNLPGLGAPRDDDPAAPGRASCSARRGRGSPTRPARGVRRRPSRSRSSARPGRSTPRPPRRSRCTPGSGSTPTWRRRLPGEAEPAEPGESRAACSHGRWAGAVQSVTCSGGHRRGTRVEIRAGRRSRIRPAPIV